MTFHHLCVDGAIYTYIVHWRQGRALRKYSVLYNMYNTHIILFNISIQLSSSLYYHKKFTRIYVI